MTRPRILAKLRPQHWFATATRELDDYGIRWHVEPPPRSGHPILCIERPDGTTASLTIPCTPRQRSNVASANIDRIVKAGIGQAAPPSCRPVIAWTPERIALLTRGVNPNAGG